MKLKNLKNLDTSFEIVFSNLNNEDEITSITDSKALQDNGLIFIKNKKFQQEFIDKKLPSNKFGIVLEKKYFESLSVDDLSNLKIWSTFIARVDDVNLSMSYFSKSFYDEKYPAPNDVVDGRIMGTAQIHPTSYIAQNVFIGENIKIGMNVKIHPGCVLMSGVEIENNTEIFPNVTLYRNVKIGKNVRIHAGTVIGSDGFGYNFNQGVHLKVWHLGSVIIHDEVEIGSNACIDSGTFSPTIIGTGSKIDNNVHIGHNCILGKGVILCGSVGMAGSCTLHDYVVVGGAANFAPGVIVGSAAQVGGMAGVTGNVEPKEIVAGFPARDIKEWLKGIAVLRKLSLSKNKE